MSRRRKKPMSPEQIAEQKRAAAERAEQLAERRSERRRLEGLGAEVNIDPRTEEVLGAYRKDVVQLMHQAGKLTQEQVDHFRNLERLLALAGEASRSCLSSLDRVNGGGDESASLDRRMRAIRELTLRQACMDAGTWAFVEELASGGALLTRWRQIAQRRTGETNSDAQSGAVRQVIRSLEAVERMIRRSRSFGTGPAGQLAPV